MPEVHQLEELTHAYRVLGISPDATVASIKDAHRRLLKRWHPDLYATKPSEYSEATRMTEMINEAYAAIAHAPLREPAQTYAPSRKSEVPERSFEEEWNRFRTRRNRIFLFMFLNAVEPITLLPAIVEICHRRFGHRFDHFEGMLFLGNMILFPVILVSLPYLLIKFCCPRCGNNFFGRPFRYPIANWYRQRCAYCSLPRGDCVAWPPRCNLYLIILHGHQHHYSG